MGWGMVAWITKHYEIRTELCDREHMTIDSQVHANIG
jgi:hypothetical protein